MRKIFSTILVLIAGCVTAQDFIVTNGENGEITDGEVFAFTTLGSEANIHIQIHNLSDQNLYFKLKAESRENTDGTSVNFCFGEVCLYAFNPGAYVPPTIYEAATIVPGGTNDINDKFFNMNPGDGENYPMIFEFGLYQYDTPDQDQTTGTKVLSFSYQYSATASTPNMTLQKLGVQVNTTLVSNEFSFKNTSDITMELFDINGRKVLTESFAEGTNVYDISDLNAGVYIARFTDKNNSSASIKIVKK